MPTETNKELILRYTALLNEAVDSYYHRQVSLMSDDAFNELYNTLADLERQYPALVCPDSPIRTVGSDLDEASLDQVPYSVPMLSIATKTDSSVVPAQDFIRKTQLLLPGEAVTYIAEPKYDGLAVNARYIDSKLVSLSTRGNKFIGENVTYNLHMIQRLPLILPVTVGGVLDVRGEVVLPTALMKRASEAVFAQWQENYATPRHMAAALLRSKSAPPETLLKPLVFLAYGMGHSDSYHPAAQSGLLKQLRDWGFETYSDILLPTTEVEALYAYHQHLYKVRDRLGYEIDGVVYKVDSFAQQKQLGVSGKEPRWAIAHKFPAAAKLSKVLDIQYQVGKTGALTPVVYIEPTEIAGISIHKLSGHNLFELRRKRIKVGSNVMVELAGDVIPQITMTVPSPVYLSNPKMPSTCPSCGSSVVRPHGATKHQCSNQVDCSPQVVGKIAHFTSRSCANIDALGEKTVQDLVTFCRVTHPYDLFTLTSEVLKEKLPEYTTAKTERILKGIADLKELPAEKVIQGLCIPGLGERASVAFCKDGRDPGSLATLSVSELECIEGLDTPTIRGITSYFSSLSNLEKYWSLLARLTGYIPATAAFASPAPKVYNKRHYDVPSDAVYIGRPTKWGNPFSHLPGQSLAEHKAETREEAVEKFETYLLEHPALLEAAKRELKGKSLVCWCAPKSCHGDILLKYANA